MSQSEKRNPEAWTWEADPPADPLWFLDKSIDKVWHRERMYPARFSWVWTRTDGLGVTLDVRMDADAGPVVVGVAISSTEGIAAADYRQPVASMARRAAAEYAQKVTVDRPGAYTVSPELAPEIGPWSRQRITARTDEERLARIVELYHSAIAEGVGVAERIADDQNVSKDTAYRLIRTARRRGMLPPSGPGPKRRKT